MKATIITISYNSEKSIRQSIESVLKQTYSRIEYIIVDGASKDHTLAIAEEYRERFREREMNLQIISEPDSGIYNAMNKGIRRASGDIIGILNSDDWYEKDAVETAIHAFEEEHCDLLFANIRMHKKDGSTFVKKARLRRYQSSRDWNHPTTFVRASLYKENPFLELGIHDDYGFFLKMRRMGVKILVVDKVLANFRMGGASNRKNLREAGKRIRDRYKYCYRINGYSRWYLIECVMIEGVKMILS